jgi:hypothetical protein
MADILPAAAAKDDNTRAWNDEVRFAATLDGASRTAQNKPPEPLNAITCTRLPDGKMDALVVTHNSNPFHTWTTTTHTVGSPEQFSGTTESKYNTGQYAGQVNKAEVGNSNDLNPRDFNASDIEKLRKSQELCKEAVPSV